MFDEALAAAHTLLAERNQSQRVPMDIAAIHSARGEKDKAIDWLSRAYDAGYKDYETLGRNPLYAGLRDDSRFQAIRRKMQGALAAMREGSADLRALRTEPVPPVRARTP